jgi:hypothetical protein
MITLDYAASLREPPRGKIFLTAVWKDCVLRERGREAAVVKTHQLKEQIGVTEMRGWIDGLIAGIVNISGNDLSRIRKWEEEVVALGG